MTQKNWWEERSTPVAQEKYSEPDWWSERSVPVSGAEQQKPAGDGVLRKAGDLGLSLLSGAVAVPEMAVGLADLASGGRAGKFLENEGGTVGFRPKPAREAVNEWHSDATKEAQRKFQEAEGLGG